MALTYRKNKFKCGVMEGKPTVWKAQQLTFPQISYETLVEEIAQSRGVNTNSTRAVVDALLNRLVHYMQIGHGVSLGSFGSFKPVFCSKVALTEDEVADTLEGKGFKKKIRFYAGGAFTNMLKGMSVTAASDALNEKA